MKNQLKNFAAITFFLLAAFATQAQHLVDPVNNLEGFASVHTENGEIIEGYITSSSFNGKGLKKLKIRNGRKKIKFQACDIRKLVVNQNTYNHNGRARKTGRRNRGWDDSRVIFERIQNPKRRGDYILAQRLNPGRRTKLRVYAYDGNWSNRTEVEGNIAIPHHELKTFYVVNGNRAYVIKRGNYKRCFEEIFAGSRQLMSLRKRERQFDDFEYHLSVYNRSRR